MKRVLKRAISILMVLALAGCGSNNGAGNTQTQSSGSIQEAGNVNVEHEQQGTETYKETIIFAAPNDLPSNAPYGNSNTQTAIVTNCTHSRLVSITETNTVIPGLATSWEANDDSTVWTFHLRDDVYFHNGEKLTASDVKFTFEYAGSNENEGINYPITGANKIASIETPDDYTVVFNLNSVCADWEYYAAQKIMSEKAIEQLGIEAGGCIGSGPYVFKNYEPGVSWSIERNEDYFGEKAITKEIVFKLISDSNARVLAVESGDVDGVLDPAESDVLSYINNPNFNVYSAKNVANVFCGFNYAREVGSNDVIREAVAMAINRDDIVAVCFGNGELGNSMNNFINSVAPGYVEVDAPEYNPEAAIELLKSQGYDENNHLKIRLISAAKFLSVAEIIQANLSMINIDVTVEEFSDSGYSSHLREDGKYDMYMQQSSSTGGLLNIVERFLVTGGASNVMNFTNAELDELVKVAAASKNMDEMQENYALVQQKIAELIPCVPIAERYIWCIGTKNLYGVDLNNQQYYVNLSGCYVVE